MGMYDAPLTVGLQQTPADVQTGGAAHLSGIKQRVVRSAAADVDVQHPAHPLFRQGLRPGAVTGNHRFQMRSGTGNHKVTERLGERHHRRARVAGFRALAGDDDGS